MLPVRLVLDTNIIVSAALKESGFSRAALNIAIAQPTRLYVSKDILAEYTDVLHRPKLGISKGLRLQMLQFIKNRSYVVIPKYRLTACTDPKDNIFLECADAARADYLITGNQRHFPPYWKSTKIITAREFIGIAAQHLWTEL